MFLVPREDTRGVGSPGTGVTGSWEVLEIEIGSYFHLSSPSSSDLFSLPLPEIFRTVLCAEVNVGRLVKGNGGPKWSRTGTEAHCI